MAAEMTGGSAINKSGLSVVSDPKGNLVRQGEKGTEVVLQGTRDVLTQMTAKTMATQVAEKVCGGPLAICSEDGPYPIDAEGKEIIITDDVDVTTLPPPVAFRKSFSFTRSGAPGI